MDILVSQQKGPVPVTVLTVQGEVTAATGDELLHKAEEAIQASTRRMVLDLGGVTFLSSAGLRTIHQIFLLLGRQEGTEDEQQRRKEMQDGSYRSPYLKLANPSPQLRDVFSTVGFDRFLEIYPNLEDAVGSYSRSREQSH